MDAYEATRIVFSRIQVLDPDHAAKIMGLLLIQDHGEKEMIRLAFGPEPLLRSVIVNAKKELGLIPNQLSFNNLPSPSWAPQDSSSPCLYFSRGYCKNGTYCKFLHGDDDVGSFGAYSPMSQLLLQQNDSQRMTAAAVAAALMLGGGSDDSPKYTPRSRVDFANMANPGARQIYLTFPADSTFSEEDVSNYFSIYGPVQDVRIPYQQKRMFGFVTFVYPETVKLILAKGNPHFVCDARVLVKPYKEKGKVLEKKQQQAERGDFSSPTDPYDLQQLGARMMYNSNSPTHEMFLRRKMEEQQQAAELQQAIELQRRKFMGLQLMDFKSRNFSHPMNIVKPHEGFSPDDKSPSPASSGEEQLVNSVNAAAAAAAAVADKEESAREASPNGDGDFQESVEHNLPDSPFASPTKSTAFARDFFGVPALATTGPELASASPFDMSSFKSCLYQVPRFSSGHGAVGL